MESCGLCLGMFPSVDYGVQKVTLNPGDTAVLFTDGITESRNKDNKDFTEERLIKLLQKNVKLSAQKLLDKVSDEVEKFTAGAERMDDMTIVIIQRCE